MRGYWLVAVLNVAHVRVIGLAGSDWGKLLVQDPGALLRAVRSGDEGAVIGLIDRARANLQVTDRENNSSLHLAAHNGHVRVAALLLERGAQVDALDEDGQTPLHAAAYNGHRFMVELLLEAGADMHAVSHSGETPLMLAKKDFELEVVAVLEDACKIAELRNDAERRFWVQYLLDNPNGLMEAVRNNDLTKVRNLLHAGGEVNPVDNDGQTVLHVAATAGHVDMVKLLLAQGALVSLTTNGGNTPLHRAAQMGHRQVAQLLLAAGAAVDLREKFGHTPLHFASDRGNLELVRMLLDAGADVSCTEHSGYTPLHKAAYWGHVEVAAMLVQHGAIVDVASENGDTPQSMAKKNKETAMVRWLDWSVNEQTFATTTEALRPTPITFGGRRNSGNSDQLEPGGSTSPRSRVNGGGWGAVRDSVRDRASATRGGASTTIMPKVSLLEAADKGMVEALTALLERGSDIMATDRLGLNALHKAALKGHTEVVEVLLARGTDISQVDKDGNTALHKACSKGHSSVVEVLLAVHEDPDPVDKSGYTPLHKAASRGHVEVAKMLLNRKADVNARGKKGDTPLMLAQLNDQREVMRVLFTHAETTTDGEGSDYGSGPAKPNDWKANIKAAEELLAAVKVGDVAAVTELLENGVNPNIIDHESNTPLHLAAARGLKAVSEVLLKSGADIQAHANLAGSTPLHVAASTGSVPVTELLLKAGAEVSAKDIFGSTPLHDAANEAVAAKLLAFGGDLHMKSKTGNCPLHRAASNGRIGVARLLLNCGANLQAKSNTGRTALALAHQFEEVDMVNLLQQLENLSSG